MAQKRLVGRFTRKAAVNPKKAPAFLITVCATTLLVGCMTQPQKEAPPAPELVDEELSAPPCPERPARQLEREAIELLDGGQTDSARHLLDCAVEQNPNSRRAKSLIEQLEADPIEFLGTKHYVHTVRPSETLSEIADERLGDNLKFVILARYNDIPVPANLVAGQRIKIPGVPPSPPPAPADEDAVELEQATETAPSPTVPEPDSELSKQRYDDALALEQQGSLIGAYKVLVALEAEGAQIPNLSEELTRLRSALIAQLEDKAYSLELAGKPDEALEVWQQLLEIDERNIPAQLSIRRLTN